MSNVLKTLTTAVLIAFGTAALAQQTPPPAPGAVPLAGDSDSDSDTPDPQAPATNGNPTGLNMGQPVADPNAPGTVYVRDTFGDWELRCTKVPEGQHEPCLMYQLLRDTKNNVAVSEFTMFNLPEGQQATAGATIVTPLETLLTKQLTLAVDGGPTKRYPFTWCSSIGCYARIGFSDADLASFKRGAKATITIVPVQAPTQQVTLEVSLKGFTKAYEAVAAANKK